MSKTLGNVVDPFELVKKWGLDAFRYYLLREISPFEDGDFSESRMKELYDSELANELGNLVLRITTLAEKDGLQAENKKNEFDKVFVELMQNFEFHKSLEWVWSNIKKLNREIDEYVPWKKTSDERKDFLLSSLGKISSIAFHLQPFLPDTAEKILISTKGKIKKTQALFPKS